MFDLLNLLLAINTDDLNKSLEILWKGLLAIVAVVGIVIIVTYIMQAISKSVAKKREAKEIKEENNSENR